MSLTHYREISEKTSIENERLKNTSAIDPIFNRLSVPQHRISSVPTVKMKHVFSKLNIFELTMRICVHFL